MHPSAFNSIDHKLLDMNSLLSGSRYAFLALPKPDIVRPDRIQTQGCNLIPSTDNIFRIYVYIYLYVFMNMYFM